MTLRGKVVAITGASGRLGRAVVEAALEAGARVAALDHAQTASQTAPAGVLALGGLDLAETAVAAQALDEVVARLGRLDVLVNIAGTFRWETLAEGSADTWDLLYRTNVRTAVCASRAAIPHMVRNGGGRIVNIGAAAAVTKAGAGMGAYTASKAGLLKLTEALAEELKDQRITVNAVLPSIIDTPANRAAMPEADFSRWVAPRDIAKLIVFLSSDDAQAVTGALIPIVGRV